MMMMMIFMKIPPKRGILLRALYKRVKFLAQKLPFYVIDIILCRSSYKKGKNLGMFGREFSQ